MQPALTAINEAIDANKKIPDKLYFVPRDLAVKAEILARLGDLKESNDLYEKSADMLDALLSRVPTPTVERQLLSDLSTVYAGYFDSLTNQGRIADAFRAIERARGRVEAQGLSHHEIITPHAPTSAELHLTRLNLQLLDTHDPFQRSGILNEIYTAEQQLNSDPPESAPLPVTLSKLQHDLGPTDLFIEYVLDEPNSYALAVGRTTVHRYELPPKGQLEQEAAQYRSEISRQKADFPLAQKLFDDLLGGIPEYKSKTHLIVVPDGKLHLLPLSALANAGQYILTSHVVTVVPSGTVLDMVMHRSDQTERDQWPYVGVAAWISTPPPTTLLATIRAQ